MQEKPDIEALLPMLANIAKDRPDIIPVEAFQKILISMGLPLERADKTRET